MSAGLAQEKSSVRGRTTAFEIPGKGQLPDSCGNWYADGFCDECGEPHFGRSACQQRQCPNCWTTWSIQRAKKVAKRLGAARYVAGNGIDRRTIHATVSPAPGAIESPKEFYEGIKVAYQQAKERGIRGGICIPHAYRVRDEIKECWREEVAEVFDGGIWNWVRENERAWADQVRWAPHYHIIGLGRDIDVEADGQWVFKTIRSLEPFRIHQEDGYEDMIGCTRYLLSHVAYTPDEQRATLRWFGSVAASSFSTDEALSSGIRDVLERYATAALRGEDVNSGVSCRREECDGTVQPICIAITEGHGGLNLTESKQRKLTRTIQWATGENKPPPELRSRGARQDIHEWLDE